MSLGSQAAGRQRLDPTHCRPQGSRSLQVEVESSSEPATSQTQSDQRHKPTSDPREAKFLASIEKLKSNISTTEGLLSRKLQEIKELKSFPGSTASGGHQEPQEPAPEAVHNQHDSSVPASLSAEDEKAALAHAHSIINRHISLLKSYNEIKNIAMGMLGLIAEKEGKRLKDVMDERGVNEDD
ncbi:hypothetical protein CLAIMM_03225 [Cladophialophora immunda]|nr:hypothetical protein CLAIMM_03225 [Cladophialophora immunda]